VPRRPKAIPSASSSPQASHAEASSSVTSVISRVRRLLRDSKLPRFVVPLIVGSVLTATLVFGGLDVLIQGAIQVGIPLVLLVQIGRRRLQSVAAHAHASRAESWTVLGVQQVRSSVARGVAVFGGGFYGAMAALTFLAYQVRQFPELRWPDLTAWIASLVDLFSGGIVGLLGHLSSFLWQLLFGIGADWIQGFVYAMIWPVHVLGWIGPWGLGIVMIAGLYGTKLLRRLFPPVDAFARDVADTSPTSAWTPLGAELLTRPEADAEARPTMSGPPTADAADGDRGDG